MDTETIKDDLQINIKFDGTFDDCDHDIVMQAVGQVSKRLGELLGAAPAKAWNTVFCIEVVFRPVSSIGEGYHGYASGRLVRLVRSKINAKIVYHELGHVLQHTIFAKRGYKGSPVAELIRQKLGTNPLAYSFRVHPDTMRGGRSSAERAADAFANWAARVFPDNQDGQALNALIETCITKFVEATARGDQRR